MSARRLFLGAFASLEPRGSSLIAATGASASAASSLAKGGLTIASSSPFTSLARFAAADAAGEDDGAARRGARPADGSVSAKPPVTCGFGARIGAGRGVGGAVVGLSFPVLGAERGAGVAPPPFALSPRKSAPRRRALVSAWSADGADVGDAVC